LSVIVDCFYDAYHVDPVLERIRNLPIMEYQELEK